MGVALGHKQTDIGVIPDDWDLVNCQSLSSLITVGIVIRPTQYYREQGVSALRSANIRADGIDGSDLVFISEKANAVLAKSRVRLGDVLTVRTGYPGTSAVVTHAFDGANCIDILITRPKATVSSTFLAAWINSEFGKSQVLRNQGGLAQQHFNVGDLRNLFVAIPPTKAEQDAIAGALSDTDALIAHLQQLLTKKRDLKLGAMQQLLRPNSADLVVQLGEISTLKGRIGWQGLKQTEFTMNADEPFLVTGMNFKDGAISWDEVYHVSEERYAHAPEIQLRSGDVLMTKDGTIGKVLYVETIPYPGRASLNSHLLLFRPIRQAYDPKYLYYQLGSRRFQEFIELHKSGTTFFGISQRAVAQYPMLLPPLENQQRIASILSDMDAAIAALEAKLAKARQIKQGMTQELLTGRIRLV